MRKAAEVVVAGHLCLDLIPDAHDLQCEPGKLHAVGPLLTSTGGPVSNTGLALHKLGINVRLVGKLGDDQLGELALRQIASYSKDLGREMIRAEGECTSYSVVLNLKRDRSFLHFSGCNDTFRASDIEFKKLKGAKIFHFGYPPLMRQMYLDDGRELETLFREAKKHGLITSLDMCMPSPGSEADHIHWPLVLERVLPFVDIFLPSAEELMLMLNRKRYDQIEKETGRDRGWIQGLTVEDREFLTETPLVLGVAIAGIKMDNRGFMIRTADRQRMSALSKLPIDLSKWAETTARSNAYRVDVVGTTGAGDATIAGFLLGLIKGFNPNEAVEAGCAVGACCCEGSDALAGIRSWDEVSGRMAAGWQKYRN